MEYLIILGMIGLGYSLRDTSDTKKTRKNIEKIPRNQKPTPDTVYTSKRSYNIFQEEQAKANILLEKSLYPQDTNVITPGPTLPIIYNKVDYESNLPIEFNNYQKYDDILIDDNKVKPVINPDLIKNNKRMPDSGGFSGISLTGDQIDPTKFTHNNMVPFFGGAVRQNLDEFSTRGIFENFTGTQDNYQKKQEMGLLFEPQKNVTNVYGTGSLDGFMLDRYAVSNIRSNETPIERVYVGPGLNQGFTNEPSGGFQQADTLDYVMPKTTDEIRVKTNPKISYYGRINPGQKVAKPSKIGTVYKNRPDTFFVNEPDRYFTTTGQVIAQEQRPCIITKYTNRKTTELKTRTGSAVPTHGTVAQVRSKYKISNKVTYIDDGPRNANTSGQWSILNMLGLNNNNKKVPNDYGKSSIRLGNTKRVLNNDNKKEGLLNLKAPNEKGVARNNQKLKDTKKNDLIKNKRQAGNFQGSTKSTVYDPNDLPKATIKETNIHNNYSGQIAQNTIGKGTVYDPNDIARTTIKETNIHNNYSGQLAQNTIGKGTVYDPNDIARTTIKETNIHNNYSGQLAQNTIGKGTVYDPNDLARTTIKETTINNNRRANINNSKEGMYTKNMDNAKTTMKQTTMVENAMGIASRTRGDGHIVKGVQVPHTIREGTSVQYYGEATGPEVGGYEVTDVSAPDTMRQETADIEYFGGAGNDSSSKPMSYEDIYNAEIKAIRATIDDGYTPGAMGPSRGLSMDDINVTTSRLGDIQNQYINERGVQANKVYNSIPQMTHLNITQEKEIVPNEPLADRINPVIVDAFRENPYTQSLNSWA